MRYRERCALCAVWLQAQCTREGPGVMCGRKCVVPWWRWDAQMQASDVRHSLVCRMPYTRHAGTKGLCRERRRTGVLPGWRLLSTPCRRPQGDHGDEHVVLRLEEQIVNSRIQRA